MSGIITVLLFLSLFWSVVLTILAFKYFIPLGIAKIRDGKTHARSERVVADAELLQNSDNQLQYGINLMILCNVKFRVYCLYVCFVSCARVRRRTEFEILSTPTKKKGKSVDNSKASHPVSTQRQQTNNYCPRDNCGFNKSAYCRRGSGNKSTSINNNANTRYKKMLTE